jgi:predicted Holliday junction resolvase-like endonuclease
MRMVLVFVPLLLLQGCVASLVKDVVTAPVRVVSKTADVLTTSQSEADEKRGRAVRKQEEKIGKLSRERNKLARKCQAGDTDACSRSEAIDEEIAEIQYRR